MNMIQRRWFAMVNGVAEYFMNPEEQTALATTRFFFDPTMQQSAAELPLAVKNKISHRGIALQSLLNLLPEKL